MFKSSLIIGYVIIVLFLTTLIVNADQTQTNQSGSNTNIDGGYTSSSATTFQSGSSSNTTSTLNPHHQQQVQQVFRNQV